MSIRIYALAQQLKVETKTLVNAMKEMGIDKGSSLASLTEDEVKIVRANFQKTAAKSNLHGASGTKEWQPPRSTTPTESGAKKIPVIKPATQGTQKKDEQPKEQHKEQTQKDTHSTPPEQKDNAKDNIKDKDKDKDKIKDKDKTQIETPASTGAAKQAADTPKTTTVTATTTIAADTPTPDKQDKKTDKTPDKTPEKISDKTSDKMPDKTSDRRDKHNKHDRRDRHDRRNKNVEKPDDVSSKTNTDDKSSHSGGEKNIAITKKDSSSIDSATPPKTPPPQHAQDKRDSKIEPKEPSQKITPPQKQSTDQKTTTPSTTSTTTAPSSTSATSSTPASTTNVSSTPKPQGSQVGKIVESKEAPKLPPAIGHIDISTIQGTSRSNQHRGGSRFGRDRNKSNSPLNHYMKKSGGDRGGNDRSDRNNGDRNDRGDRGDRGDRNDRGDRGDRGDRNKQQQQQGGGNGSQKSQNQQQQQKQNQHQQQKQQQQQRPKQPQNINQKSNTQFTQPIKKSLAGKFDSGAEVLTRDSNYWLQRNSADGKILDLDNNKRKKIDDGAENKKDAKTPQENKLDPAKQQTNQNNKKPQNIFLAPIPTVRTKRQPKEPEAQKPDKRLPAEVIRNVLTSGSGSSVDEFIRKHKDKQREKDQARRARDLAKRGGRGGGGGSGGGERSGERSGGSGSGERSGDRGGLRSDRDRDRDRDRGGLRGNRDRDRDRDRGDRNRVGGGVSGDRVAGQVQTDRVNKDAGARGLDKTDRGGSGSGGGGRSRPDRERDRHGRGGGRGGSGGGGVSDGSQLRTGMPFGDFGGSGRTIRDSSRIAEEKRRIRAKKRARHNSDFDDDGSMNIPRQLKRVKSRDGKAVSTAAPRKGNLIIHLPCTVKQFSEQTGTTLSVVIKKALELGIRIQLNSQMDVETVELLAEALDIQITIKENVSLEDRLVTTLFEQADEPESLKPRPPVVTVLGHVDHGKTTMLDNILKLNVVSGEKGGITQHIRAYRVKMENGEDITFVDTPGHEAFTEMRARGAGCTDIAILVVAADDGVMPQTEEAISHAKAAGVPIIVAINKMDLPGVNPDRVLQELAANDLLPEEWGGDVPVVRCSALTGAGLDKLLETIQLMAEIHELKANPDRAAIGVALEAELQSGQGAVCKVIVQKGTLRTGDIVLCGTAYGRVKAMYDTLDVKRQVEEATPSTPVNLVGLDIAPGAGSRFCVLDDISDARVIAEQRQVELRKNELAEVQHVTLETLFQRIKDSQTIQTLNVIIRADVRGSIEAIRKELAKLSHPEVKIKILQATVGGISEADVHLADASDAIIVGFNVVPDENARVMAERKKIQVRRYDIIYNLTDDIKKALEGMLKPLEHVKELGRAVVQQVFTISRIGTIAGCRVMSGNIERDCKIRIIRESRIIGEYPLDSLKREKDDVKEVREGYECGMKLKGFNDLKDGDILEAYKIESVARTF
ncbi:MAG: translation initiation factor IF-2 [Planctomycetaceae bacterium]|nr:translation initiation factor IF-2 [Planctomycetaceae bacterium]